MTANDLFALFRADVSDAVAPYLWSDLEVWNYMNDAYRMFARNIGGIPDISSDATVVQIVAGAATSEVSPAILKFRNAYLESDGSYLHIINEPQAAVLLGQRYSTTPGTVKYMVTGADRSAERGLVRWINTPSANDTCRLSILRLPLEPVAAGSEFDDIGPEHHDALLLWMKARAYGKQDAETFDRGRRDQYQMQFAEYCRMVRAEQDQYRSHTAPMAYGGI